MRVAAVAVVTPFVPLGAGGGEGITATAITLVRLPFWYQAILAFLFPTHPPGLPVGVIVERNKWKGHEQKVC